MGLSPRIAGVNVHWRAATTAASSRSACPDDVVTSTFDTWPSASTVTARLTSACSRAASAEGGYTASTCETTVGGFTSPAAATCPRDAGAMQVAKPKANNAAFGAYRWHMDDAGIPCRLVS